MASDLSLPLASGALPLSTLSDPLLVGPGPRLFTAVVDAYRAAVPELVDPSVDALTAGESAAPVTEGLPTLALLAGADAIEAATAGFRSASRLAALVDAEVIDLRVLDAPQPNAVLAGAETGFAVVAEPTGDGDDGVADRWHRVGDDPTLRERYASLFADADPHRPRTPSRRTVFEGFARRADEAVAVAVLRALDVPADSGGGVADPGPDPEATRIRAYATGVREGLLDHTLRRACEDAGLGSPSTFTRIKRLLAEADLLEIVSESQPVGRPRQRLVARGALAAAETPAETVAAVRDVGG